MVSLDPVFFPAIASFISIVISGENGLSAVAASAEYISGTKAVVRTNPRKIFENTRDLR